MPYVVEVSNDGKAVSIQLNEKDDVMTFHAAWLWSNNPSFVHLSSKQRQVTPGSYHGTRIDQATIICVNPVHSPLTPSSPGCCHPISYLTDDDDNVELRNTNTDSTKQLLLSISWEDSSSMISYYDFEWLRHWRYDIMSLQQRREQVEVSSASIGAIDELFPQDLGGVQVFDYHSVLLPETNQTNGRGVYNVLHAIFTTGAAILSNAPTNSPDGRKDPAVACIGEALCGYNLSHGMLYGDLFHVQSSFSPDEDSPNNIAYTSLPLKPHQDLAYYESMPGLQLLHCVEFDNSVLGGESTLVDCMAAAYHFRKLAPHHFEILTRVSATFVKQRRGANMIYQRPHIVLKGSSLEDEIVAVNWSPPFEGPLLCPPHIVESYYAAYQAFELMLDESAKATKDNQLLLELSSYAKKYTWKYRLKPGEILVFNNRRMVHGRCGFSTIKNNTSVDTPSKINRHLIGCYTNIDDTLNRYRTLQRKFGERDAIVQMKNAGNGSSLVT